MNEQLEEAQRVVAEIRKLIDSLPPMQRRPSPVRTRLAAWWTERNA